MFTYMIEFMIFEWATKPDASLMMVAFNESPESPYSDN